MMLTSKIAHKQPPQNFWAFDSEFLVSGRINRPEDVQSVQFSNGKDSYVLECADALKQWLRNHHRIQTLFAFVALPDLGSIEEWLGEGHVKYRQRGSQLIGQITYRGFKAMVYDARPLLQNFGFRRLEDCGKTVGTPKLARPDWLGIRGWQNNDEHKQFVEYAAQDAVITSRIVKWLFDKFRASPELHASAGTLAKHEFSLPKRLIREKKTVILSPLERAVKNICFAGRSEAFYTGYTPNVYYNDVTSLYPSSVVATRALQIVGAKQCAVDEIQISNDLSEKNYGWLEGVFESNNDMWGLPLRGRNNFYATGVIQGLYHTFDLAAAKVTVHHITRAYKPVFSNATGTHEKYADMLLRRLEDKMHDDERMLAKAILNSLSGKIGQSHPLAVTSNFFAYSTILAHSHTIMSQLYSKCNTPILGTDTDSIFTQADMSGRQFELTDGEVSLPVLVDVKGKGDLAMFRSKNYILKAKDEDKPSVYGRHGWVYFIEDYLKLFNGDTKQLTTRQDIKHTLLTRQNEAKKLAKGRWRTKPVTLGLEEIKNLLKADTKRSRTTYDSYELLVQKKSANSNSWAYDEIMALTDDKLGYPRVFLQ
jgi:hypothetical protein